MTEVYPPSIAATQLSKSRPWSRWSTTGIGELSPYFLTASAMRFAPTFLSSSVPLAKSTRPPMKALARSAPWSMAGLRKVSCISITALAWATALTLNAPCA